MKSQILPKYIQSSLALAGTHAAMALTLPSGENLEIVNGSLKAVGPVIINQSASYQNTNVASSQPVFVLGGGNINTGTGGGANIGRGLVVGDTNRLATDLNNTAGYGFVLGYNNKARIYGSVVAGSGNEVSAGTSVASSFGKFTSVFGKLNVVNSGVDGAYASLVFGGENHLTGDYSLVGGRYNTVGGQAIGSETSHSVALGDSNLIASGTGWTIGRENSVTGLESAAFGTGLDANWRGAVVLGTYNADPGVTDGSPTAYGSTSPLLLVGNGTSDTQRSNGLILRRSGNLEVSGKIFSDGYQIATESYVNYRVGQIHSSLYNRSVTLSGGYAYLDEYLATAVSGGWAYGVKSFASSDGWASGDRSTSLGGYASGDRSFAVSEGTAQGIGSVAIGWSSADGAYSVAIGRNLSAGSLHSIALGTGNVIDQGMPYGWSDTDVLFSLGNSNDDWVRTNAITTLKNGRTTLTNKWWKLNTQTGDSDSGGYALVVEGHASMEGDTVLKGKTFIEGEITISNPQGDISMGIYE